MNGRFRREFSQLIMVVASFGVRGVQQSEMAMIGGFRWNFPQAGVEVTLISVRSPSKKSMVAMIGSFRGIFPNGLSLILTRSRSKKSVVAMIGGFPNQTSSKNMTGIIGKSVTEL